MPHLIISITSSVTAVLHMIHTIPHTQLTSNMYGFLTGLCSHSYCQNKGTQGIIGANFLQPDVKPTVSKQ